MDAISALLRANMGSFLGCFPLTGRFGFHFISITLYLSQILELADGVEAMGKNRNKSSSDHQLVKPKPNIYFNGAMKGIWRGWLIRGRKKSWQFSKEPMLFIDSFMPSWQLPFFFIHSFLPPREPRFPYCFFKSHPVTCVFLPSPLRTWRTMWPLSSLCRRRWPSSWLCLCSSVSSRSLRSSSVSSPLSSGPAWLPWVTFLCFLEGSSVRGIK